MNKKLIRLTESDLHRIVKESVDRVLNEMDKEDYFDTDSLVSNINSKLSQLGDVQIFQNNISSVDARQFTVKANKGIGRNGLRQIVNILREFGYNYKELSQHDVDFYQSAYPQLLNKYVMLGFKRNDVY